MNIIQQFSGLANDRLPKVITPKGHAVADYLVAAGAFIAAFAFFKSGRKAAGIGALITGAVQVLNPMITDFPGGVFDVIDFPTHGRVDMGANSMAASMPQVLGLHDGESKFFYIHAGIGLAVTAMTDYNRNGQAASQTA